MQGEGFVPKYRSDRKLNNEREKKDNSFIWASARFRTRGDFSPTDAVNTLGLLGISLAELLSLSNHLTIQKANISIRFTQDGDVDCTFHYSPRIVCFYSLHRCWRKPAWERMRNGRNGSVVTKLTANSLFSKSRIVTESYKTSKSMRDHSKNA